MKQLNLATEMTASRTSDNVAVSVLMRAPGGFQLRDHARQFTPRIVADEPRNGHVDAQSQHPGYAMARRIERSIAYMSEHLNEPLRVSQLAALLKISSSYFFALFKQQTGVAPNEFFTRLRIARACHLLETTELSVKEIAGVLGYADPFYFSRVFKLLKGTSPTAYRMSMEPGKIPTGAPAPAAPGQRETRPAGQNNQVARGLIL